MSRRHPMPDVIWCVLNARNRLSGTCPMLSIPMGVLCDFDAHYALSTSDGDVVASARTFREAMRIRKHGNLNLTRILERD